MAQLSNTFEGGTAGTTITPANSGGASGNAFTNAVTGTGATLDYSSAHAHGGVLAARLGSGSFAGGVRLDYVQTITEDYGRGYFYVEGPGTPAGDMPLIGWRNTSNSNAGEIRWSTGGGKLFIQNAAFSTVTGSTSTTTLPLDAWFRLDYHFVPSATVGALAVHIFVGANVDGSTPDETISVTGQAFGANIGRTFFGFDTNVTNVPGSGRFLYIDDVTVGAPTWVAAPVTVQTARPSSTVAAGGWTATGAASLHAATSDQSDSSYIAGTAA